jgi:hypothetical protein
MGGKQTRSGTSPAGHLGVIAEADAAPAFAKKPRATPVESEELLFVPEQLES